MTFPTNQIDASHTVVFRRTDGSDPRVTDMPISRIVASVIDALADHGDDAELMMVRRERSMGSQTVLAVANAAWLDTEGEFVFGIGNRDRAAMDAIKSAPRSWALVAMTQAMIASTNILEAAQWYHTLLANGVEATSGLVVTGESAYVYNNGRDVPLSLRYADLYRDICLGLEREGRAVY